MSIVVNDIHSRLNATEVAAVIEIESIEAIQSAVRAVRARGGAIAVAAGHHAMGRQQFATEGTLLDTRLMKRVLAFDRERGTMEVEAGVQWPTLIVISDPFVSVASGHQGWRKRRHGGEFFR